MRLWHQSLISKLPRQQLLGQHRECCALRGTGWGRRHSIVDYVFTYEPDRLVAYHILIMNEMKTRGYNPDPIWRDVTYRGKTLGYDEDNWCNTHTVLKFLKNNNIIYPEHNGNYLKECLDNLKTKGIEIEV